MYEYRCELNRVVDGDTVLVDIDLGCHIWKRGEYVRLLGIDTPELYGKDPHERHRANDAKDFVISWFGDGGDFIIKTKTDKTGKYGRLLGSIFKDGDMSESLSMALANAGHRKKEQPPG
jgi:micrococcal nuclease